MPDYSQGKIYKIVNDENDKFYIGSTTQPLYKRMHQHRIMYGCSTSKMEVNMWNCSIILVETIECKNKDELLRKEREYIEKYREEGLNIVNKNLPGRKLKEYKDIYYQKNKGVMIKKAKEYRKKNLEYCKIKDKEHYKKNKEEILKKVTCDCGSIITKKCLIRHKKSKKHLKYLEELNN